MVYSLEMFLCKSQGPPPFNYAAEGSRGKQPIIEPINFKSTDPFCCCGDVLFINFMTTTSIV